MSDEIRELKDDMRADMLRDQLHEKRMISDSEYFIEYVVENLRFDKPIHLFDVHQKVHEYCLKYDNDVKVSDVFEYMKSM